MPSTEELLRKATLTETTAGGAESIGIGGAGQAPLSVEQVTAFIELMAAQQVMLSDVRVVHNAASKWQESILNFSARIARPGVEATRLGASDRVKPSTGIVEISSVLIRGEVPVSDEVLEDNVAAQNLVGSLERTISDRFGFDIEDLFCNGDTGSGDSYLALLDGWLKNAKSNGNAVDASSLGQDYQEIFRTLLNKLPDRYKRNLYTDGRFYIPLRSAEKWRDILANRGTPLGDLKLMDGGTITYQGIPIVGVPAFAIAAGSPDQASFLLTNRNNLYAGFHRAMKFETWRDPREGVTSFVITARVDAKIAVAGATAVAYNVDVGV